MNVNDDFAARASVHADATPWVDSPMAGVQRKLLDRIGDEVARATSIVRYAPGSHFSPHVHTGGEEFLVLDGVFSDEHGDFPAGSYVRNPPQSSHTPGSEPGCTILVKLWQFDPDDRHEVKHRADDLRFETAPERPGVEVAPLHDDDRESVRLETWAADSTQALELPGGGEFFVLEGSFGEGDETFDVNDWLRLPVDGRLEAKVGPSGARVWVKTGHLAHPTALPAGT